MSYQILLNSTAWWRNSRAPNIQAEQKRSLNNNVDEYVPSQGRRTKALKGLDPKTDGSRMVLEIESAPENNHKNQERRVVFLEPPAKNNEFGKDINIWEEDPHLYVRWIEDRLMDPELATIAQYRMPSLENKNLRATMMQRMKNINAKGDSFGCESCGTEHPINISYRPRRVIVSDSSLNLKNGIPENPFDLEHHEYLHLPGWDIEAITRFYYETMKMDPAQQLIYALVGLNDILHGHSFEEVIESLEKFEAMVSALDKLHGRTGANRSRLAFGTLPHIPKLLKIPKQGIHSEDQSWLTKGGSVILNVNHWLEHYNQVSFPLQKVPKAHSNGWRSVRKNKSSLERVWSRRKDAWRSSEPKSDSVHYSNEMIGKILNDIRIFLREVLVEVQDKKEAESRTKVATSASSSLCKNNNIYSGPSCEIVYEDITSDEERFSEDEDPKDHEYAFILEPDQQDLDI